MERQIMRTSADHILTSHAGSLPRPDELIEANRAREAGDASDEQVFQEKLRAAVGEVVRRQKEVGIDVPGDGEFGKSMGQRVNYGAWRSYSFSRLGGLDLGAPSPYDATPRRSRSGEVVLTNFADRRDRARFAAAYADPDSGTSMGHRPVAPTCIGPLTYIGHDAIRADIANFQAALTAAGVREGFMTSVGPASCSRIGNDYYKTEEEFVYACAEAMREEYKAILDAGLVLQLDDPAIAENWDLINPEPTVEDYKKFTMVRVEALNHAIRGLPQDGIRFHLCWGSWHGPHTTDIPMRDIVEVMLAINVTAYSFEAGNVRHEHEWKVWEDVKLPDGKLILPGVVSHATNVVEHPELVAERILRFANLVGRERVIASTDCGLGGRVHPDIAWAKLDALAQGAALASRQLWR
jgi:5-methyltetrahydropteroyltriglutamate--homocysteine methyltransferase